MDGPALVAQFVEGGKLPEIVNRFDRKTVVGRVVEFELFDGERKTYRPVEATVSSPDGVFGSTVVPAQSRPAVVSWIGESVDAKGTHSTAGFTLFPDPKRGWLLTGLLTSGDQMYRVEVNELGQEVLYDNDALAWRNTERPLPDERTSGPLVRSSSAVSTSELTASAVGDVVDVMVARTNESPSGAERVETILEIVREIDDMNLALYESQMSMRVRLIWLEDNVPYDSGTLNAGQIVSQLATGSSTVMSTLRARRDQVGADLLGLTFRGGTRSGQAIAIPSASGDPNTAYAVWDNLWTGHLEAAHELGHLLGGRHDPAKDSTASPYAYSHAKVVSKGDGTHYFATVMASTYYGDGLALPQYSNPNVLFIGGSDYSGDVSQRNNSLSLQNLAPITSNYRSHVWNTTSLGCCYTSAPDAESWDVNHLDVFARGPAPDYNVMHQWWNGASWSSQYNLGGSATSGPGVVSRASGYLEVFVSAGDGNLYHKWFDGSWYPAWVPLSPPPVGLSPNFRDPDAVSWNSSHMDLFVTANDGALWHTWWNGAIWSSWQSLGGCLSSSPSVTSWGSGRIDVFARGCDLHVYGLVFDAGSWGSWTDFGVSTNGGIEAISWTTPTVPSTSLDLYYKTSAQTINGSTYVQIPLDPFGSGWSPWALEMTSVSSNYDLGSASRSFGRENIFYVSTTGVLTDRWHVA